jgi:predicted N-acetyltransferase YhbS
MIQDIIIKQANEDEEFRQIHQINYMTFVEEIPQHQQNESRMLVDKFHHKNQYIIAKNGDRVLGMVTYNFERPFSLDEKIHNLDALLPQFSRLAEIRLLSILPEARHTTLAYRMLKHLCNELMDLGADAAIISGTTRQLALYSKIGFKPFSELIGKEGAQYQPMFININTVRSDFKFNKSQYRAG